MSPAANLPPGEQTPKHCHAQTPSASQAAVYRREATDELSSDPPCGRLRHGPTNEGDRWELPEVSLREKMGRDKRYR